MRSRECMGEPSIFIEESGDFDPHEPHTPYYQ